MFIRPRQPEEQHPPGVIDAPDVAELVSRVGAGDAGAFEAIMRRHNRLLFRTARGIVDDDAEAQDVVQDAYLLASPACTRFAATPAWAPGWSASRSIQPSAPSAKKAARSSSTSAPS